MFTFDEIRPSIKQALRVILLLVSRGVSNKKYKVTFACDSAFGVGLWKLWQEIRGQCANPCKSKVYD